MTVISRHETINWPDRLYASGFQPDRPITNEKGINTPSVDDGHRVGVGRVVTGSSFHHFTNLSRTGDPCMLEVSTEGLSEEMLNDMAAVYVNLEWLAHLRTQKS